MAIAAGTIGTEVGNILIEIGKMLIKGKGVGEIAQGLLKGLGVIAKIPTIGLNAARVALVFASAAITKLAEMFGISTGGEHPARIGYRVLEAEKHPEWKKRDDFKSFEEYNSYLKEQIPTVDDEKLKEKWEACALMGDAVLINEITRGTGFEVGGEFLFNMVKWGLKVWEIFVILNVFKDEGYGSTSAVNDYMQGNMSIKESRTIHSALVDAFMAENPKVSKESVEDRLSEIRNAAKADPETCPVFEDSLTDLKAGVAGNDGKELQMDSPAVRKYVEGKVE